MRISHKGGQKAFPLILLITIFGLPLYAKGSGDTRGNDDPGAGLKNASALVEEGRLDDALRVLVDIARKNPDQIGRVQKIVLNIRDQEKKINTLFKDIQSLIAREDVEAREKVRQLEALFKKIKKIDSDPVSNTWKNLALIESTLRQLLEAVHRDEIFRQGNEKLARHQYENAVQEYRKGFLNTIFDESRTYEKYRDAESPEDIDNDEMSLDRQKTIIAAYRKTAPEGDILIGEIESLLDSWKQHSIHLTRMQISIAEAVSRLNPEHWSEALNEYQGILDTISGDIDSSEALTEQLKALKLQLYKDLNDIPEDFRYDRIGSFLTGRVDKEPEGILFTQENQWENAFIHLLSEMLARLRHTYANGWISFNALELDDALGLYSLSVDIAGKTLEIIQRVHTAPEARKGTGIPRFVERLDSMSTEIQVTSEASVTRQQLVEINRNQPNMDDASLLALSLEETQSLSDNLQVFIRQYETLLNAWNDSMDEYSSFTGSGLPEIQKIDADLKNDLNAQLRKLYGFRDNTFILYVEPRYRKLDTQISDIENNTLKSMEEARNLLGEGLPTTQKKKIDLALNKLNSLSDDVTHFLDTIGDILSKTSVSKNNQKILSLQTKAREGLATLNSAINNWQNIKKEAVTQRNTALKAETIAKVALDDAEHLIKLAREVDTAGRTTNDISESYRSKELYTSAAVALLKGKNHLKMIESNDKAIAEKSGIAEHLSALEAEILSAPRTLAVTVRDHAISEADNTFVERRYNEGLSVLLQAQEFWVSVFGEEDIRLRERIARFKVAQQSVQDTVIDANDPLYLEMNQYVNLANRYYNEGLQLSSPGSRSTTNTDMLKAFAVANELLQQVLNVFPDNATVLLLKMKILKATDPDKYAKTVRSLIREAQKALRIKDRVALEGTAFKQGLDPRIHAEYSFDPDFPALAPLVHQIDIFMGRVIPEPSRKDINRSKSITRSVNTDWEQTKTLKSSAVSTASPGLIKRLDKALVLWENNIEAVNLQDAIRFYTAPKPTPEGLRLLIDRVEEAMSRNSVSTVQIIYDAIIAQYPGFKNHPDVLKINTWQNHRK